MKEILKFDNFLTENLYTETYETAKYLLTQGKNLFCTNNWWDKAIVEDSFPVLIHNIEKNSKLFSDLKQTIELKTDCFIGENNLMFYYWTRFSYIPWHQDYVDKTGFTLYLNDNWNENYGGYFLYREPKDEQEIKAVIPKRNMALLQRGGIHHTTTPVNFNGQIRFTLQAFLDNK